MKRLKPVSGTWICEGGAVLIRICLGGASCIAWRDAARSGSSYWSFGGLVDLGVVAMGAVMRCGGSGDADGVGGIGGSGGLSMTRRWNWVWRKERLSA